MRRSFPPEGTPSVPLCSSMANPWLGLSMAYPGASPSNPKTTVTGLSRHANRPGPFCPLMLRSPQRRTEYPLGQQHSKNLRVRATHHCLRKPRCCAKGTTTLGIILGNEGRRWSSEPFYDPQIPASSRKPSPAPRRIRDRQRAPPLRIRGKQRSWRLAR